MAVSAMGTKLQIGINAIAELKSVSGLEISVDTLDTTALDSGGWRTFIQGMRDAGEVSVSGYFNPSDTQGQKALYDSLMAGTVLSYSILFPSGLGATWSFQGVVTKFTTSAEMEAVVSFEASIKVSGIPALGVSASAGLTSVAFTPAGTQNPAFSSSKYVYSLTFTGTSLALVPTGSGQTIKVYVNGTLTNTLSSGDSATIAFAAINDAKLITLVAAENGKTANVYEYAAVRTA